MSEFNAGEVLSQELFTISRVGARLEETYVGNVTARNLPDDLNREVYCVFGIPLDKIGMQEALERIETAVRHRTPYLLTTANINFLINSLFDEEFRETIVHSDLCLADGMWLVWLGWLIGVPIATRVPGSDLLDMLRRGRSKERALEVFLFGGPEGSAERASLEINVRGEGLRCVGFANPGIVSVEQISGEEWVAAINQSQADFLVAALGAKKGQLWLHRNHDRFATPVRAHLGAVVNFYSQKIKRAPRLVQLSGLEWLWRIKEEPALWRRYVHDGLQAARLLLSTLAPLLFLSIYLKIMQGDQDCGLTVREGGDARQRVIFLQGSLTSRHVDKAARAFAAASSGEQDMIVDLSGARVVDPRFLGLFFMLKKTARRRGRKVKFVGPSRLLELQMRLYGFPIAQP